MRRKTVTIKSGTHVVELRDIKDGALTVVNVTKSINIPLPSYSVKFLDDDGTVLKTQTVERYKSASAPKVSNKTDKTFTGWDKPFQNVREDLVITAQYATNTYTVNFFGLGWACVEKHKTVFTWRKLHLRRPRRPEKGIFFRDGRAIIPMLRETEPLLPPIKYGPSLLPLIPMEALLLHLQPSLMEIKQVRQLIQ